MNQELLKTRVKDRVKFKYFHDNTLYYECVDGFTFPIPVNETTNEQGASPVFQAEDKAIFFMRWIRKAMDNA